jgi:hypothetical protein
LCFAEDSSATCGERNHTREEEGLYSVLC